MKFAFKLLFFIIFLIVTYFFFSADYIECDKEIDLCKVKSNIHMGTRVRGYKLSSFATVGCRVDMEFFDEVQDLPVFIRYKLHRDRLYVRRLATLKTKDLRALEVDLFPMDSRYCNYLAMELDYFLYDDDLEKIKISNFTLPYRIRDFFRFLLYYKVEL